MDRGTCEFSDSWLSWITHGGRRLLVVLQGYLDESERSDGTFVVAGCLFSPSDGKKFSRQWSGIFGPYGGCHMKDLVHRVGSYALLSGKNQEFDRIMERAVTVLTHRVELMAIVTTTVADAGEVFGATNNDQASRFAYAACAISAGIGMAGYSMHVRGHAPIALTFEAGRRGYDQIGRFYDAVAGNAGYVTDFCYGGHTPMPKDRCIWLQSADFVAWEWGKFKENTLDKWDDRRSEARPPRKSFSALIRGVRTRGTVYRRTLTRDRLVRHRDWLEREFWPAAWGSP